MPSHTQDRQDDNPVDETPQPMDMERVKQQITQAGPSYFTMIPHMADDDLPPYAFRLYGHYRRVCSDTGSCWEGTRRTAKVCRMSAGAVVKWRRWLADHGWVVLHDPADQHDTLKITIVDRWLENMQRYALRSPGEHPRSSGERKNISSKNKGVRERTARPRDAVFDWIALHVFGIRDSAEMQGGRVAKLATVVRRTLGDTEAEGQVAALAQFAQWYAGRYEGIDLPRDATKFEEHWLAWRSAGNTGPARAVEGEDYTT